MFLKFIKKYCTIFICIAVLIFGLIANGDVEGDTVYRKGDGSSAEISSDAEMERFFSNGVDPLIQNWVDGEEQRTMYSGFTAQIRENANYDEYSEQMVLDLAVNEEAVYWRLKRDISFDGESGGFVLEMYATEDCLLLCVEEYYGMLAEDLIDTVANTSEVPPIHLLADAQSTTIPQLGNNTQSVTVPQVDDTYSFNEAVELIMQHNLLGRWVDVSNEWYFEEVREEFNDLLEEASELLWSAVETGLDEENSFDFDYSSQEKPSIDVVDEWIAYSVTFLNIDNTEIDGDLEKRAVDLVDYVE